METAAFDYELPPERIAQEPLAQRDAARLLVDRGDGTPPDHRRVADLPDLLEPGDLLVINTTRVLPARLPLQRPTGGAAEVLLLEPRPDRADVAVEGGQVWEALVRPSRKLRPGATLLPSTDGAPTSRHRSHAPTDDGLVAGGPSEPGAPFGGGGGPGGPSEPGAPFDDGLVAGGPSEPGAPFDGGGGPGGPSEPGAPFDGGGFHVRVHDDLGEGRRLVELVVDGDLLDALVHHGEMPLPPYITAPLGEPDRYQTVYAERPASAAAPTAGLHLTSDVLARCAERGIERADVELVVGLGTFRPIAVDDVADHVMHHEAYRVPEATMEAVGRTRAAGGRVVAVGTTSVRALESAAATGALEGRTDLYIRRPYPWQVVDRLLTNFHLPRSSLLVMVDAFVGPRWRALYAAALADDYRFLSFGDAMLLSRHA